MALGAKKTGNPCHVYTIIGDGESQEGLVWEASMAAAHYHLDNLTVIFDHNGLQIDGSNDEGMSLGDIQTICSRCWMRCTRPPAPASRA